MPTAGPNYVGTAADDAGIGTITWSNPGNSTASDDAYASHTGAGGAVSHFLKGTNCGFAIPGGSTINGILVEIEVSKGGSGGCNDSTVKIVKSDGSIGSTNKGTATAITATDTFRSYGGASDLWGESWTDTDINSSNFGVVISITHPGNSTAQVDAMRITVYYSAGGGARALLTNSFLTHSVLVRGLA